jgi:hypothetical protein
MAMQFVLLIACAQFPVVDSADFAPKTQAAALAATVRIRDQSRSVTGSGVIVGGDDRGTYVLTAAHLIERIEQVEVQTFTAKSYPEPAETIAKVELVAKSDSLRDLAVLRVAVLKTPPCRLVPPGHALPKTPFKGLFLGCQDDKPPRAHQDEVRTAKKARRDSTQEPVLFWEVAAKQAAGQSGGPLLDREGFLLGICSGNNKDASYFCHAEEIHAFLKAHHLEFLVEAKPKAKSDTPKKPGGKTGRAAFSDFAGNHFNLAADQSGRAARREWQTRQLEELAAFLLDFDPIFYKA